MEAEQREEELRGQAVEEIFGFECLDSVSSRSNLNPAAAEFVPLHSSASRSPDLGLRSLSPLLGDLPPLDWEDLLSLEIPPESSPRLLPITSDPWLTQNEELVTTLVSNTRAEVTTWEAPLSVAPPSLVTGQHTPVTSWASSTETTYTTWSTSDHSAESSPCRDQHEYCGKTYHRVRVLPPATPTTQTVSVETPSGDFAVPITPLPQTEEARKPVWPRPATPLVVAQPPYVIGQPKVAPPDPTRYLVAGTFGVDPKKVHKVTRLRPGKKAEISYHVTLPHGEVSVSERPDRQVTKPPARPPVPEITVTRRLPRTPIAPPSRPTKPRQPCQVQDDAVKVVASSVGTQTIKRWDSSGIGDVEIHVAAANATTQTPARGIDVPLRLLTEKESRVFHSRIPRPRKEWQATESKK